MRLLNRNPLQRLGAAKGAAEIRAHPWFSGIDWKEVLEKRIYVFKYPIKTLSSKTIEKCDLEDLIITDRKLEMQGYKIKYQEPELL